MSKRSKSPAPVNIVITNTNNTSGGSGGGGSQYEPPKAKLSGAAMKKMYKPMFDSIDTDGSGEIDSTELYEAMCKMFPKANITPATIADMMAEADVDNDGEISLEEFSDVMVLAEGKSGMWHRAQENLWEKFKNSGREIVTVVDSAAQPMREFARQHSYLDQSSGRPMKLASVGLRVVACLAEGFFYATLHNFSFFYFSEFASRVQQKLDNNERYRSFKGVEEGQWAVGFLFFLIVLLIVGLMNFVNACYGKTLGMHFLGIRVVDINGQPFSLFGFIFFSIFFLMFSAIEWLFLLCSGRTIAERITGGYVVVDEPVVPRFRAA